MEVELVSANMDGGRVSIIGTRSGIGRDDNVKVDEGNISLRVVVKMDSESRGDVGVGEAVSKHLEQCLSSSRPHIYRICQIGGRRRRH